MTFLLGPQKLAGPSKFQIVTGDMKARAEVSKLLDDAQSGPRLLLEDRLAGHQKIAIASFATSTDPATQLVELGEPQTIGMINQE